MRSNISAGASTIQANVTPGMMKLVEIIRPKLTIDGLFFVGIDIVGDKLMEINVFSPGGLVSCERLEKAKFCQQIIHNLEQKVESIVHNNCRFNNSEMNML